MENQQFICVSSGHEPERKTEYPEQMIAMIKAKRREYNFGTHHRVKLD